MIESHIERLQSEKEKDIERERESGYIYIYIRERERKGSVAEMYEVHRLQTTLGATERDR